MKFTPIEKMTLDECLWARSKEEQILDQMLEQDPKPSMNLFLKQLSKLECLDFWIDRKENNVN